MIGQEVDGVRYVWGHQGRYHLRIRRARFGRWQGEIICESQMYADTNPYATFWARRTKEAVRAWGNRHLDQIEAGRKRWAPDAADPGRRSGIRHRPTPAIHVGGVPVASPMTCCGSTGPGHRAICPTRPPDPYGWQWLVVDQLMADDVAVIPRPHGRESFEHSMRHGGYFGRVVELKPDDEHGSGLVIVSDLCERDGTVVGARVESPYARGAGIQIVAR